MPNGQIGIPAYPWLEQGMALPAGGIKTADFSGRLDPPLHSLEFSGVHSTLFFPANHDDIGLTREVVNLAGTDYSVIKFPQGIYFIMGKLDAALNANPYMGSLSICDIRDDDSEWLVSISNNFYLPSGTGENMTLCVWGIWRSYDNGPGDKWDRIGFSYHDLTGAQANLMDSGSTSYFMDLLIIQLKAGNFPY